MRRTTAETYARRLGEAGPAILAIRNNLGHADLKTTEGYIVPPQAIYACDLSTLNSMKTLET